MRLRDTIWIRAAPERIFGFFEEMHDNYLCWHPSHRLFRWESGANRLLASIVPRLVLQITPAGEGSEFTAEIQIRTGPVGAWLNRREFDAVRRHMREEGENMKRLLEGEEASP